MKKKSIVVLITVLLSICMVFTGCTDNTPPPPDNGNKPEITVTLDKNTAKITVGDQLILKTTITGADEGAVAQWSTSAEAVATVVNGTVTAVSPGTATIIASVGAKAAACIVTVQAKIVKTLSLNMRLDKEYNMVTMAQGSSYDIRPVVTGAKLGDIVWASSAPSVAVVDSGVVTAKTEGTAKITATLDDIVKAIDFKVYSGASDGVHNLDYCTNVPGFVKFDATGKSPSNAWYNGETTVTRFDVGARPDAGVGAEWLRIGFAKQEEDVAVRFDFAFDGDYTECYDTTNFAGNLMGVMDVTTGHGYSFAECIKDSHASAQGYEGERLRLYDPDGSLIESPNEFTIKKGQVYTLEYILDQFDIGKFFSIFMATNDRVYIANVTTVINHDPTVSLEVEPTEIHTMTELETAVSVKVKNADIADIVWTMADPTVAKCENGKVTGLKVGSTTLTAVLENITKTIKIEVAAREVVVTLKNSESIYTQQTKVLVAQVQNALTGYTMQWVSSNTDKLTVDNGSITGIQSTAADAPVTVTLTVKEGDAVKATATCLVTVEDKAAITIADGNGVTYNGFTVAKGNTFNLRPKVIGGTVADVVWKSSNDSVATVALGIVTGVKAGNAVITGTLKDATITCNVTVYEGKGTYNLGYTNGDNGCIITDATSTQTKWAEGSYAYSVPVGVQRNDGSLGADTLRFGFAKNAGDVAVRFEFYLDKDFWTADGFNTAGMGNNFMGVINPAFSWVECVKMSNAADQGEKPGYEGSRIKIYSSNGLIITPTEDSFTAGNVYTMEIDYTGLADGDKFGVFMATIQNVYIANIQILTYTAPAV